MQTKRPTDRSIRNLADQVYDRMFHQKYDNKIIKYTQQDIIQFLNLMSQKPDVTDPIKCYWGDAIISMPSMKSCFNQMGIRGNKLQQQGKQTMCSSVMVLDGNNNIVNKKMIKDIIPQKSNPCKNAFVKKCKQIRTDFNANNTNILCNDETLTRMS